MSISLKTELTGDGIKCTYADNGAYAGIIRAQPNGWAAFPLDGEAKEWRKLDAAEYYTLACAIEARASAAA